MQYVGIILWKNERNVQFQDPPDFSSGTFYRLTKLDAAVINRGAEGMITFHAACHVDTLGTNQDAQNIVLKEGAKGNIRFQFWVEESALEEVDRMDSWDSAFTVQAVNLGDIPP